jgi:acyl carrier protein
VELVNVFQVSEDVLELVIELKQFEGWDSTAVINLIVLLDENGAEVDEEKVPECKTVQDVLDLAGDAIK